MSLEEWGGIIFPSFWLFSGLDCLIMQRKKFIGSLLATTGWGVAMAMPGASVAAELVNHDKIIFPPYLKPGDCIGIPAPAGFISENDVKPMVNALKNSGYQVKLGKTIGQKFFNFSANDQDRLADLQEMIDNPNIKAIWIARGGYGLMRILDQLHLDELKKNPKWIIGFSDVTALHLHLFRQINLASIHAKMSHGFAADPTTLDANQINSLDSALHAIEGVPANCYCPSHSENRLGKTEGILVGGNLSIIQSLLNSDSDINTDHKILFVEDTGEYLYQIDRIFTSLQRAGKLKKLKGLIVGGFNLKKDDEGEEFAYNLQEIILQKLEGTNFPVCFNFPVGHQKLNMALKCGGMYRLQVKTNEVWLQEI